MDERTLWRSAGLDERWFLIPDGVVPLESGGSEGVSLVTLDGRHRVVDAAWVEPYRVDRAAAEARLSETVRGWFQGLGSISWRSAVDRRPAPGEPWPVEVRLAETLGVPVEAVRDPAQAARALEAALERLGASLGPPASAEEQEHRARALQRALGAVDATPAALAAALWDDEGANRVRRAAEALGERARALRASVTEA